MIQLNGSENSVLVIDIVMFFHVNKQFSDVNQVIFFKYVCYVTTLVLSQWRNSLFVLWLGCRVSGLSMLLKDTWTGGAALGFKAWLLHLGDDLDFK